MALNFKKNGSYQSSSGGLTLRMLLNYFPGELQAYLGRQKKNQSVGTARYETRHQIYSNTFDTSSGSPNDWEVLTQKL